MEEDIGQLADRIRAVFEDPELVWKGHFELVSGKHSGIYWAKFSVLQQPSLLSVLCEPILRRYREMDVDVVIGPALGGALVAYEVARQMGKRVCFAEKASDGVASVFRPPVILRSDHKVLIVDDVMATGWTINHVLDIVHSIGLNVIGIGVILDRSPTTPTFPYPLFAVHRMPTSVCSPEDCPLCAQGIPLMKRTRFGSGATSGMISKPESGLVHGGS